MADGIRINLRNLSGSCSHTSKNNVTTGMGSIRSPFNRPQVSIVLNGEGKLSRERGRALRGVGVMYTEPGQGNLDVTFDFWLEVVYPDVLCGTRTPSYPSA